MAEIQLELSYLQLILLFFGQIVVNQASNRPLDSLITINTTSGLFQGQQVSLGNTLVGQFFTIPYGEKPTRFGRSHLKSSSNVSRASNRTICPQRRSLDADEQIDEDCLTLNLFLPRHHLHERKAILVFIHGGSNQVGSGAQFDGTALAAFGDVIVITINYRLNLFGYLQSNEGLYDQLLALEWISINAKNFHGDAQRITLFGQSTGAVNALLLAMSSRSHGLIRRVIAQSGTPLHSWAIDREPWKRVEQVLFQNGLKTKKKHFSSNLEQLKTRPLNEIRYAEQSLFPNYPYPKIDQDLIPDHLEHSILHGPLKQVDLLIGTTSSEWSYLSETDPSIDLRTLFEQIYPTYACFYDEIRRRYFLDKPSKFNRTVITQNYRNLVSDLLFYYDFIRFLRQRSASDPSGTTYVYFSNLFNSSFNNRDSTLNLLQGQMLRPQTNSNNEIDLSYQMIRYWSNFVKTGNPNEPESISIQWPMYNATNRSYLTVEFDRIFIEKNLLEDTYHYWHILFHRPVCIPFRWYHKTLLIGILILALFLILLSIFHNTKRARRNIKPIEMTTSEMFAHYQYLPSVVS